MIYEGYFAGEAHYIEQYFRTVLRTSPYPKAFPRTLEISFDPEAKLLLAEIQLPNLLEIPLLKDGPKYTLKSVSDRERKSLHEATAYAFIVRTLYELARADEVGCVSLIGINGWLRYTDPTDGHVKKSFVLSLAADPVKVRKINIASVVPKEFFKAIAGRASPDLSTVVGVPPILRFDRSDARIVESDFSIASLDQATNLAALPWEDFEHLIREVFSHQFTTDGSEVRVTRASRDGGVDAIAWDPDPVRGGKFVIQAKRYTNTVGVSAVRDLYGTLMNEGANRGILVTTSGFGPDAIEFAKDKAISLVDGRMLLGMLEKQGHHFRIDLAEAKRIAEQMS